MHIPPKRHRKTLRCLPHIMPRAPMVWWEVMGRKHFDLKTNPKIRAMKGCGEYALFNEAVRPYPTNPRRK